MSEGIPNGGETLLLVEQRRIDQACLAFEDAWKSGEPVAIEQFMDEFSARGSALLLRELLLIELAYRRQRGETPVAAEYETRFPGTEAVIAEVFQHLAAASPETAGRGSTAARGGPALPNGAADEQPAGASALPRLPAIPGHEILCFLGRGGMGWVLKARHLVLSRVVAIKMPLPGHVADATDRARFLREAQAVAKLRHANICPIYEVGEAGDQPYITMAYIEGPSLAAWAKDHRPTAREAAQMVAAVARAVGYAHEHGLLHRDIKPSNVMVDASSGQPILMDFGLAKEQALDQGDLTQEGQVLGTPAYMAPEQAAGHVQLIDTRSDVYALGGVLYYLMCGRPPFTGSVGEVLRQVQSDEPVPPRRLAPRTHRDLETICLKAMAKAPAARYASAVALAEDLERFCAGESIVARPRGLLARSVRAVARRPVVSVVMAVAVLAMISGGVLLVRGQQERRMASLLASLEMDFDTGDWSAAGLEKMDGTIRQLQHWAPAQADTAQQRLAQRFAAGIEEQLKIASLGPEQVAQIDASLVLLADRAPEQVATLRKAFQRRLQTWETLFHLRTPFASLESVFDPAEVKVEQNGLVRMSVDPSKPLLSILTHAPSRGIVRFEVVLDASWDRAQQVGIGLAVSGKKPQLAISDLRGYHFLLHNLPLDLSGGNGSRPGSSFATSRRSGGQISIEILHDATRLRTARVDADRLPSGPLRLVASKAGDQLQFSVGDLPLVEFLDAFGSSGTAAGVFALYWPAKTRILDLRALRQSISESPSPLEQGDSLYASGLYSQALAAYENQARTYGTAEIGQQVRYKEALCLLALERGKEAEPLLERLASEPGGRWAALAACRLWLELVRQKRFDQSDASFESLSARYRVEQLVVFIPQDLHGEIVRGYFHQAKGLNVYKPNPALVAQCERALAIAELFNAETDLHAETRHHLLRAYRAGGQEERAFQSAEAFVGRLKLGRSPWAMRNIMDEYIWMLQLARGHQRALDEIDRWISAGEVPAKWAIARACSLYGLGRFAEAERTLDDWFAEPANAEWNWARACAMRGFLCERRGDHAGARLAWRDGKRFSFTDSNTLGFPTIEGLIDASLADAVTEDDAKALCHLVSARVEKDSSIALLNSLAIESVLPPKPLSVVFREAFRSPRGRGYAEKIIFRSIPYAEWMEAPARLLLLEAIRQGLPPSPISAAQDELLWQLSGECYRAVAVSDKIEKPQALQLLLTWKGMTNFLGWGGVAPSLEAGLRGKLAYFLGHRYLRLGRRDDAAMFFRTALTDAPADSPLKNLAVEELDALTPTHAPDKEPGQNIPNGSQGKN